MGVHIFTIILFFVVGFFCVLVGLFGWKWFLQSRNASMMLRLFGPKLVRVVYGVIGLSLIAMSIVISRSVGLGGYLMAKFC